MSYVKIPLLPGFQKDESKLKARHFFIDGNDVCVNNGGMEALPGREHASSDTFLGICRGISGWRDNQGLRHTFFGTHLRAYAFHDAQIYDITPAISRDDLSNPFDTTDGDETVTVNHTAHGLVVNQKVSFANASAVGGITPDGEYVVATVPDANSYTIEHSSAATSTVSGGGGTVDYEYFLAPGLRDGVGNFGFGTGGYGSGDFGKGTVGSVFARTYSAAPWGEEELFMPEGGSIYSFNPRDEAYTTATEKVTNGGFATDTDWTKGTGWAIGSGVASATTASADLEQNLTLQAGCYYLLDFDVSNVSAGNVTPKWGSTAIGAAITANDTYKRVFHSGAGGTQALKFTGAGFTGDLDNVSVKQLQYGTIIANAPTQNGSMIVTPERIVMVLGTLDSNNNYNALLAKWSDQEDYEDWTASGSNLAGDFLLGTGGRGIRVLNGRGEVLLFTDIGLWAARFTGDPATVYSFTEIATGCGLVGPNAAIVTEHGAFWMSPGGEVHYYNGGVVVPIESSLERDLRDNIQFVTYDKIYAMHFASRHVVRWYYVDRRDSTNEISRYVEYNYIDKAWVSGTVARTAGIDRGFEEYPVAADENGKLWYMDKGDSVNGGAKTGFLISGFMDDGDGKAAMQISAFIPDFDDLSGGGTITFYGRNSPGGSISTYGPYNFNASTNRIPLRILKREIAFRLDWNTAPFFMRLGAFRLDMKKTDIRRAS